MMQMKMLLFCFFALGLLAVGCKQDAPKDPTPPPTPAKELTAEEKLQLDIDNKVLEQVKSGKKQLFLIAGYQLGANEKAVEAHTRDMVTKKVLRPVQVSKRKTFYVYQMPLNGKKAAKLDVYMEARYKQSVLTMLVGKLGSQKGSKGTAGDMSGIVEVFTGWYGPPAFKLPPYNGCDRFAWIDGNRYIDLRCEGTEVHFAFYDLANEKPPQFTAQAPQIEIIDKK